MRTRLIINRTTTSTTPGFTLTHRQEEQIKLVLHHKNSVFKITVEEDLIISEQTSKYM